MIADRTIYIPLFISILAIGIFYWVGFIISAVWLFVPATIITFLIYLSTFYKKMPAPNQILPIYLLALSIQMLHFAEEYLTGFVVELPLLFGQDPYPEDYWLVFNMAAYAFFIIGGIVLLKRIKELAFIPLFFILVAAIFNPIAHLGLSIYKAGYFPGLYTAVIYIIIAPFLIKLIFKDVDKNVLE
ncbi:MAG: hypothetical protein ACR2MM_01635 [Flavobacteriaceae bacterium]